MEQGVLEYERVREKKKQLLIKIQETKVGIRHKQNQLQLLEEGLKRIQEQEGSESIGGNLNIFLRDFSVILEALKSDDAFMETKYATQSAQVYYRVEKNVFEDYVKYRSLLIIVNSWVLYAGKAISAFSQVEKRENIFYQKK